jgi:TolA-binding protein
VKRPPPRRGEPLDELLGQLVLDERDGPALPLGEQSAQALVRSARERCTPAARGKLFRFPKLPLIGIGVVVATSAAAAALGGVPRLLELVSNAQTPVEVRAPAARDRHPPGQRRDDAPKANAPDPTALASTPAASRDTPSPAPTDEGPLPSEAPARSEAPSERVMIPERSEAPSERVMIPERSEEPSERAMIPGRSEAPSERVIPERSASAQRTASRAKPPRAPSDAVPSRRTREPASGSRSRRELVLDRVTSADSAPAADLLGEANRARMERRFAAALDAYRRVIASFPETRQAQIARVSAGDLELERGDPSAAEQLFSRAVRDADVGAEALFGLAEAYRVQQRVVEERRALVLFGQRYPSNPLALAAQRRLSQLDEAHAPK